MAQARRRPRNFGLPSGFASTDLAVLWGSLPAPDRSGLYTLRMVNESGAWKCDFLGLSSATDTTAMTGGGQRSNTSGFARPGLSARLLCDRNGMPKDDRAVALAARVKPALQSKLAEPFGSDEARASTSTAWRPRRSRQGRRRRQSFSVSQQGGNPEFTLEIAKAGGAKAAYLLKLEKVARPVGRRALHQ